jgi:DNA-binding beta-propeller fold protein YncE
VTQRPALLALAALLAIGLCGSACRKDRAAAPGAASGTAQASPEPTPTEVPVEPPSFSQAPAPGLPPWAQLNEPRGAALDAKGRVWIADFGHSRLKVFDPAGGYLGGWGGKGSETHGFNNPTAIAISGDTIYVADTWNSRVEAFSLGGERKTAVTGFYGPRGVAVAPGGAVFVSDTGNHRVMLYDAELKEGRAVGSRGDGPEQVSDPVGVAVGPSGAVYVADVGNRRVQVLDGKGRFVTRWSVPGWTPAGEPFLAVGASDTVYLSDPTASRVLAFTRDGKPLRSWDADDEGRKLSAPTGLALDARASVLYVVDKGANTVSKLALTPKKAK